MRLPLIQFGGYVRREEAIEVLKEISKRSKGQASVDSVSIAPSKEPHSLFPESSETKFRLYLQTSITMLSEYGIQTYLDSKGLKMLDSENRVIVYRPPRTAKEKGIIPGLLILRRKRFVRNRLITQFHFAVVNLGHSDYPSNFLCLLPSLASMFMMIASFQECLEKRASQ